MDEEEARLDRARVMDSACETARRKLVEYIEDSVLVESTGYIVEKEAKSIEADVNEALKNDLVAPGDAGAAYIVINRAWNITSTNSMPVTVFIRSKGYLSSIVITIGFENPALAAA